jgi:hypothetical protein
VNERDPAGKHWLLQLVEGFPLIEAEMAKTWDGYQLPAFRDRPRHDPILPELEWTNIYGVPLCCGSSPFRLDSF